MQGKKEFDYDGYDKANNELRNDRLASGEYTKPAIMRFNKNKTRAWVEHQIFLPMNRNDLLYPDVQAPQKEGKTCQRCGIKFYDYGCNKGRYCNFVCYAFANFSYNTAVRHVLKRISRMEELMRECDKRLMAQ